MSPAATILIIDDDTSFLRATSLALKNEFEVISFSDPHEAMPALKTAQAIVVDFKMRTGDGTDVLRRVSQENILAPVILVTAYADKGMAIQAANLHAFAILEKPVDLETLRTTIKAATREFELRRIAGALARSEAQLKKAQYHARLGNWSWNLKTDELEWSDEMYRLFGAEKETLQGSMADLLIQAIHPDDLAMMKQAKAAALKDKTLASIECRVVHKDKSVHVLWVELGEISLDDEGSPSLLSGIVQDITERKKLENELLAAKSAAEEATESKAKFLAIAAHELRNPVSMFALFLDLAKKQIESGKPVNAAMLCRLQGPASRLARLVVDLLDISRLERGLMVLRPARSDLGLLIQTFVEEFQLQFQNRRFIFTGPGQVIEAEVDPVRLNQVISNLVDNAIKYTPEDRPIELRIDPKPKGVRVSVIDQGAGIPKDQLELLFSEFVRGTSENTDRTRGLGLGLSVCRRIMELHGGTIGVSSELGRGSTFYLELPKGND